MHLVCLAPSYGTHTLPRNLLALFLNQNMRYDSAHLLFYCDDGLIETQSGGEPPLTWEVYGTNQWVPLQDKYNIMLEMDCCKKADGYVITDCDDIYLPDHLLGHCLALENGLWSHPSVAFSDYGVDLTKDPPNPKQLSGRHYHGSLALRRELLEKLGGYPITDRSDYDKQMLTKCREAAPKQDPAVFVGPTYCYRWSSSGFSHISAGIKDGKYPMPKIHEKPWVGKLIPELDHNTKLILEWLS